MDMFAMSSSDVRKEWSSVIDSVVRRKPVFIKRTRDRMILCSDETMAQIVGDITFDAEQYTEEDGSVTLSLDAPDLAANGEDLQAAKAKLARDIVEYAEEYYQEFELYSRAPNRRGHLPYVIKALIAKSPEELEAAIVCRDGRI